MAARELITADDVRSVPEGGELFAGPGAIVTPWAREIAESRGVRITLEARPRAAAVALGADHGGFALKEALKARLERSGRGVRDVGTHSSDPVDYPDFALAVARAVASGEARFGVVIDGAGIGSAMAANKVPGIRAAACNTLDLARNAREHNDANVLTLGARFLSPEQALEIVEAFTALRCAEERHLKRVAKIVAIEESYGRRPVRRGARER